MDPFLTSGFLTLFILVDPIGVAPIFLSLTLGMTAAEKRRLALRAMLIATGILGFFAVAGQPFLGAMGISLPAFRIAGGLLLFWTAFEMIFEKRTERKTKTAKKAMDEPGHDGLAAFPLAMPLLAGPGAITAVMLLADQSTTHPFGIFSVLGLILAIMLVSIVTLLAAVQVEKIISQTVRTILTRLLGVILTALAVQFVVDGIIEIFETASKAA